MKDFKKEISKIIAKNVELSEEELYQFIEIPKDTTMGDYAFPCFKLAKQMHKAPQIIATELKEKLDLDDSDIIEKIEVAGGYLNFYLNKDSKEEGSKISIGANGLYQLSPLEIGMINTNKMLSIFLMFCPEIASPNCSAIALKDTLQFSKPKSLHIFHLPPMIAYT